jgi:hypothetical protein
VKSGYRTKLALVARPPLKQRKIVGIMSDLTAAPMPELASMIHDEAQAWLGARWQEYMGAGGS